MSGWPLKARIFAYGVSLVAAVLVVVSVSTLTWSQDSWRVVLALAAVSFVVPFAFGAQDVVMVAPVAIAAAVIGGPGPAAVVGASSAFTMLQRNLRGRFRTSAISAAFNTAQLTLSAWIAALAYEALQPVHQTDYASALSGVPARALAAVVVASLVYTLVNSSLFVIADRLTNGRTPGTLRLVLGAMPSEVVYCLLGAGMAVLWESVGAFAMFLAVLPLVVAQWAMRQYVDERDSYQATVRALVKTVETKDAYTRGHSERVAQACVLMGESLQLSQSRITALQYAGILHDIGKVGVSTTLLQKSGRLSEDEFQQVWLHPVRGHEIIKDIEFLREALVGILHHHERLDGRGYPMGLKGEEIPYFARVIAVADAFDSMTSTRSYRNARTVPEALDEIIQCRGSQFDPVMVDALVHALDRESWQVSDPPVTSSAISSADHDDPVYFGPLPGRGEGEK